jgi:hypothetical protein
MKPIPDTKREDILKLLRSYYLEFHRSAYKIITEAISGTSTPEIGKRGQVKPETTPELSPDLDETPEQFFNTFSIEGGGRKRRPQWKTSLDTIEQERHLFGNSELAKETVGEGRLR